jgi:hypothetical protein
MTDLNNAAAAELLLHRLRALAREDQRTQALGGALRLSVPALHSHLMDLGWTAAEAAVGINQLLVEAQEEILKRF